MTRYFLTLIIAFATIMSAGAQSFTDNLQRKQQGKGNVSVKQSSEIDALVNGKKNAPKTKEQLKAEKILEKNFGDCLKGGKKTRERGPQSRERSEKERHCRNERDQCHTSETRSGDACIARRESGGEESTRPFASNPHHNETCATCEDWAGR